MDENFNQSYIGIRPDILKHIRGKNLSIIDVGCATGSNGKYLLKQEIANSITGIEFCSKMAAEAEKHYSVVHVGDLNSNDFRQSILLNNNHVDFIIFGDILEHLYEPEEVLKDLIKLLKPKGKIIISLPNIAHIELFIQVYINGTWPQNARGIFDKTHIRWFTKKDALKLVKKVGLNLEVYEQNFRPRDTIGSKYNLFLKVIKKINKQWLTFQHILVCSHG